VVTAYGGLIDRLAPQFARDEPLRHAGQLMFGMLSGLDRKNCWTIAEHCGEVSPDGLQHRLAQQRPGRHLRRVELPSLLRLHYLEHGPTFPTDVARRPA